MKTKKFFMVLVALFMGSQMVMFAQDSKGKRPEKKKFTQEQMLEMQSQHIINALALNDETAAKFKPVYVKYMEEMRATRKLNPRFKAEDKSENKSATDKRTPRPALSDAEVEQAIKARFAQSRKMLDIREKYYNEFRQFLSPKQIQKMYNMEKKTGDKMRKEMNKRQGMKNNNHNGRK